MQIRDFRLLWLGRFSAIVATTGMVVIIGYQLYDIARTHYGMSIAQASLQLGLLGLAQFVPLFLLTPLAGVAADRFDRRVVAAIAIAVDFAIAIVLAVTTLNGLTSLPLLFGLAAAHGAARVFVNPSTGAMLPNIVPAAMMPRAVAMGSLGWQSGMMAGPAVAGLVFALRADMAYWLAAALLAISCLSVVAIARMPPPQAAREVHPYHQVVEGFRYVWRERFLLGCVTLDLFAVLLGGATALLPVFARDILQVGSEGLGIMRAAPSVGAMLVGLVLSWRPLETNVGTKMLLAVAGYGLATIGFGLSRGFALSLGFLVLLGMADMVSVFVRSSLVQLNTPDDVRGRVSAISGLAISASNELGEMQSGIAAALLGATGAVVFGGMGAIVVTVLWAVLFPELRNAKTFAPQYRATSIEKEGAT